MRDAFEAVIIGAGPAGSSAAILLARAGWSVALVEKQVYPRRKVCGECIAASNLPLLDALGLGAMFEASAGPELRKVVFMHGNNSVVADLPSAKHEKFQWGRALGRETLDTMLLEQARMSGATILQPWSVQKINGSAGNWYCEIRNENTQALQKLHASVAIAANGSWESLPSERPSRRLARSASDLFAFKANFNQVNLEDGLLALLSFDGGYGGMVVADDAQATLACCIRRNKLQELRHESPSERVGDIVEAMLKRESIGVRSALQGALLTGNWLSTGPINPGIKISPDEDLFRIGNAAGEAHPIIGEGISMALQSAWLLCAYLVKAQNSDQIRIATSHREIATAYATEWRQSFAPRLRLAAIFAHTAMRPVCAISMLALIKLLPGILTSGAKLSGKVRCEISPEIIKLLTPSNHHLNAALPFNRYENGDKFERVSKLTIKELI